MSKRICCRVYVTYGTECVENKVDKLWTINLTKLLDCFVKEGLRVDRKFVKKTLSATPRPWYHWKAEDLSFLHVLLVWGVNLTCLLNKMCHS